MFKLFYTANSSTRFSENILKPWECCYFPFNFFFIQQTTNTFDTVCFSGLYNDMYLTLHSTLNTSRMYASSECLRFTYLTVLYLFILQNASTDFTHNESNFPTDSSELNCNSKTSITQGKGRVSTIFVGPVLGALPCVDLYRVGARWNVCSARGPPLIN